MVIRCLCAILISATFFACSSSNNQERDELARMEAKWDELGRNSYQINSQIICFCPSIEEVVMTVVDDQIVEAFYSLSGDNLTNQQLDGLRTVRQHFDIIDDATSRNAEHLDVEYHATFGFPTLISIDYSERVADDEVTYRLSNLQ